MIELYNALKFITMLLLIKKISRFNLGVAFLKSVSIYARIAYRFKVQCTDVLKYTHYMIRHKKRAGSLYTMG